jgi:hypothetical protein
MTEQKDLTEHGFGKSHRLTINISHNQEDRDAKNRPEIEQRSKPGLIQHE